MWSGLVLAVAFAVLLSLLLLASFVWVELVRPFELRLGWLALGSVWGGSAAVSLGRAGRTSPEQARAGEVLFREALSEYLQGNWFEAEAALSRVLGRDKRDVEARLLLATLLRRRRRFDEAANQLDRLERLLDAARWSEEIAAERRWIAEASCDAAKVDNIDETEDSASPTARQAA
jgi:cytochrome c-type biogenesis protein CcmH/NrfG